MRVTRCLQRPWIPTWLTENEVHRSQALSSGGQEDHLSEWRPHANRFEAEAGSGCCNSGQHHGFPGLAPNSSTRASTLGHPQESCRQM